MPTPKVLVIEDNEQNMYLVTYLLKQRNCEVLSATNGPDGIEMARREQPTIVLLDIQLPKMDGYAVAKALLKLETMQDTPIIAVTSYAMPGDREKTLEAGCTGYIEKPINPDTFLDQVFAFLELEE